jgi:hypothetical protein
MTNAKYVNNIKVTSVPFIKVASDFKSVNIGSSLWCASDGYLTVWWPWDRSCFSSLSVPALIHLYWPHLLVVSPLWTGSDSGSCCPWWSFWPSCDIGCCRCPGGQVVFPRWCDDGQTAPPSGEPCGCGRCSCHTRRWYRRPSIVHLSKFVRVLGAKPNKHSQCRRALFHFHCEEMQQ